MTNSHYDAIVIGAGVVGCAISRELSRYKANVLVLEAQQDVCCGTSKANSAIVHAGFDAQPNSLKARYNVAGNKLMYKVCKDLDVACYNIGSLVVCNDEKDRPKLEELFNRGIKNGVDGLRIIERKELLDLEPNIADTAVCALHAPTAGIVDVFGLTVAYAENAACNGVEFSFNSRVVALSNTNGTFTLYCENGQEYTASSVINAAGLFADEIHNLLLKNDLVHIIPRKGEYFLLDTSAGDHVKHTIFSLPTDMGKGVLVSPTTHGNLLVGPTATDMLDKDATSTTQEGLDYIRLACTRSVKDVPLSETITSFAGVRAHLESHDFIVGQSTEVPLYFEALGIESPGLTAAPAIAVDLAQAVAHGLKLAKKTPGEFQATRKGIVNLKTISHDAWNKLIEHDSKYGQIICRCCVVSEAQIVDAIHRIPGAHTLDGVKRRTSSSMGRCQGGFCLPRIMEILAREIEALEIEDIEKEAKGSYVVSGHPKKLMELSFYESL